VLTRLAPVPRRTRMICALALAAGTATIAACGSEGIDGSLSPDQSRALLEQVDAVERAVEAQDCTTAETDTQQLIGAINALPAEVGTELKGALRQTSENLLERVKAECEESVEPAETEELDPTEPETEEAPPETEPDTETDAEEEPEIPEESGDDEEGGPPGGGHGPGGSDGSGGTGGPED
jgi:chemotaxis protein histidine kinase CheA